MKAVRVSVRYQLTEIESYSVGCQLIASLDTLD